MNINKKDITINPHLVDVDPQSTKVINIPDIDNIITSTWSEYLSQSRLNIESLKATNRETKVDNYIHALQFLDCKIAAARKTFTFWDAYNITSNVSTVNDFIAQYGSLAPNSSIMIADRLTFNGITYNTGDLVVKNNHDDLIHIHSAESGAYEPSIDTTNGNTVQLKFRYTTNPRSNITLQVPVQETGTLYNSVLTFDANKRATLPIINNSIRPLWEARIYNNTYGLIGETVYDAISVEKHDNEYVFINNSSLSLCVIIK